MKKLALLFVLGLTLCTSAFAEAPSKASADLDSIFAASGQCSVTKTCTRPDGSQSTVSCSSSTGPCTVGSNFVECAGRRVTCFQGSNFCTAVVSTPSCFLFCSSQNGACSKTATSVTCDGVTQRCP
jgi:hypothetical protein